jgi:hypothetical protein
MRRAVGILSTAIVPIFVAGMAFAADPYGAGSERGTYGHEPGATSGTSGTSMGFMGEHTMTGRITSIDKDKGHVKVDAQGETLDLHFPQSALQNLNKGDQVTVSLGIKPSTGTSGTSGTGSRPGSMGTGTPSSPGTGSRGSTDEPMNR